MGCAQSIQTVEDHTNPSSAAEILKILKTGSTHVLHIQYYAALCDGCLQDGWRTKVKQAGGIPVLVAALAIPDRMISFCAVEGLVNFSTIAEYRGIISHTQNLYEHMIALITDKIYDDIGLVTRELALWLLTNTCIDFDDGSGFIHNHKINESVRIACQAGVVPAVVNWLADKRNLTTETIQTSL